MFNAFIFIHTVTKHLLYSIAYLCGEGAADLHHIAMALSRESGSLKEKEGCFQGFLVELQKEKW